MSKLLILIAATLLLIGSVNARIGETREQCDARYGKNIGTNSTPDEALYLTNGLYVAVQFSNNKAEKLEIKKQAREINRNRDVPKQLTFEEVEVLRASNSGANKWVVDKQTSLWVTEDGSMWSRDDVAARVLTIATTEYKERVRAQKKAAREKEDAAAKASTKE
jgi:hypothetical protein